MNDIDYEPDMDPGRCCCGYVEGHGPDPRPSKSYIDGWCCCDEQSEAAR